MKLVLHKHFSLYLSEESASHVFAKQLAAYLKPALVLTFSGEIGAGKTTIIRAMLQALGVEVRIKSPTFSIVESYTGAAMQIHHFDLYRIDEASALDYLGFREYFSGTSLCCIEWPQNAGKELPAVDLSLHLAIQGMGRSLQVQAQSRAGEVIVDRLVSELC